MQEGYDGIDHPILYFSKKFDKHQRNYWTTEKESLCRNGELERSYEVS